MSKRALIIGGSLIIIASVIAYLLFFEKVPVKSNDNTATELTANELPLLNVIKTDGSTISLRDVEEKTVLIYFNPDCDHCQREATQISNRKSIFNDYTVYFISIDSMHRIEQFAKEYNLVENNFVFAQADNYEVYEAVGALQSVPAIFIYNKRRLIKRTEGEVQLEELMKYL
jgi:peroxiredoxin